MKKLWISLVVLSGVVLSGADWHEDFKKGDPKNGNFPIGWKSEGRLPGVPNTKVFVKDGVLRLEADKSSGGVILVVKNVDLKRTPILRWRWRALTLPEDGDGRVPDKDDQAVGIYVGMSGFITHKSVAYHYDTVTPKDVWGETSYIMGAVKVKFLALRNRDDKLGEWYVEERDIAKDLQQEYGEIPKNFAVSIICNSHNTKTKAVAEVDYIEFGPRKTEK